MAEPPAPEGVEHDEGDEGGCEQDDRDGRRPAHVVALDLAEDVDGGNLGLEGDVAGYEDDRAELPDRPREGERAAGEDGGREVRQDDAAEDRPGTGPERRRRLLHLLVELEQHGLHRAHDEGEGDEQEREHDRNARVGDVDAEWPPRPVEREEGEARDDRRERERQVDQCVDEALAAKGVADEHPGDQGAGRGVDRHDDERGDESQLERGDGSRAGNGVPETVRATLRRAPENRRERQEDDESEIGRRETAPERHPPGRGTFREAKRERSSRNLLTPPGPVRSWRRARYRDQRTST